MQTNGITCQYYVQISSTKQTHITGTNSSLLLIERLPMIADIEQQMTAKGPADKGLCLPAYEPRLPKIKTSSWHLQPSCITAWTKCSYLTDLVRKASRGWQVSWASVQFFLSLKVVGQNINGGKNPLDPFLITLLVEFVFYICL